MLRRSGPTEDTDGKHITQDSNRHGLALKVRGRGEKKDAAGKYYTLDIKCFLRRRVAQAQFPS